MTTSQAIAALRFRMRAAHHPRQAVDHLRAKGRTLPEAVRLVAAARSAS